MVDKQTVKKMVCLPVNKKWWEIGTVDWAKNRRTEEKATTTEDMGAVWNGTGGHLPCLLTHSWSFLFSVQEASAAEEPATGTDEALRMKLKRSADVVTAVVWLDSVRAKLNMLSLV